MLKFIYSEKATIFCKISTVDLIFMDYIGQIYGGDFAKKCGLLRMYELYLPWIIFKRERSNTACTVLV